MEQKIIIVDEKDKVIGCKDRNAVRQEDIYRASSLWITNSRGEILLAKRALNKSHDPGKWGPAVEGTVDEGEDYETNIIKEAEEEIGLNNIEPRLGPKERISGKYNYFAQLYTLTVDKPLNEFVIHHGEVDEIRWFSRKDLVNDIQDIPANFLKMMERWLELFCG